MAFHHETIRKYTAALLDFFNDVEVQYKKSNGKIVTKNVPIKYSAIEKARHLDNFTTEQLLSGNYNVLPRGVIALRSLSKNPSRQLNKNNKIANFKSDSTLEFMYNSVSYIFNYDIIYQCRGMNEATQIIEQIAPKFNPTVNIDVWDAQNLSEPTRVPVNLNDISIETESYEELSSNITMVTFSLSLVGNLYPPIKSYPRIKEFQIYLNETLDDKNAIRKDLLEWYVNDDGQISDE